MNVKCRTLLAAAGCALLTQCTLHQQRGAAFGALGGAAVGALAGDDSHDVVRGAAVGAAVGTGVAAMTEPGRPGNPAPPASGNPGARPPGDGTPPPSPGPATPPPASVEDYPLASRTDKPNQVISPFPPFNVIDVTGFRPGQLARDPSNQKIFRVP